MAVPNLSKIQISDIKTDPDFVSSSKTIRIGTSGEMKFRTPIKPSLDGMDGTSSVREIYRKIKPETLDNCMNNQDYDSKYGASTNRMRDCQSLNIFSLTYNSKDQIPSDKQIMQMSDIQYNNTDVIVLPSWFDLVRCRDKSQSEMYLNLSDTFLAYSSYRNHKPVMASIPTCIPNDRIPEVLKHHIDNNVTSFILDYHGRSMMNGTWLRNFTREWDSYGLENEGIL